jgi:formylmethanofuran dehydrogenase subunit E
MKRSVLIFNMVFLVLGFIWGCSTETAKESAAKRQFPDWFYEQEPIKIIDNSMVMLGNTDNPLITLSLVDLIYNHGHMCSGSAVGYRAIKEANRRLFGDQIPVRGEIRVISSVNTCPADIFTHVLGVRDKYGNRGKLNTLIIPDQSDSRKGMKFVFQRIKREAGQVKVLKTVQIELVQGTIPPEFYRLRDLVRSKQGTADDKRKLKQISQETYTKILRARPDEIFIVKELPAYEIPSIAEFSE